MDTTKRSLVKTITWRITGTGATFAISYAIVGDFSVSSSIAAIQLTFNTLLYFCHERIWEKIKWGRQTLSSQ
jgi:uncharacterized membrane protein